MRLFSNCNLRCVFCQNWPISHEGRGKEIKDEDLADMMIGLQGIGCHNINLVTPTCVMPNILNATRIALNKGLRIPLVYNTSGYERLEIVSCAVSPEVASGRNNSEIEISNAPNIFRILVIWNSNLFRPALARRFATCLENYVAAVVRRKWRLWN